MLLIKKEEKENKLMLIKEHNMEIQAIAQKNIGKTSSTRRKNIVVRESSESIAEGEQVTNENVNQ